jgi:hypothetical protein
MERLFCYGLPKNGVFINTMEIIINEFGVNKIRKISIEKIDESPFIMITSELLNGKELSEMVMFICEKITLFEIKTVSEHQRP